MWHYGLLGVPILTLVLFFVVQFDRALLLYLVCVSIAFVIYYSFEFKRQKDI